MLYAWVFSPQDMILVLLLGVLLFGRKLPEIGRSVGKSIVEFKKGMRGMEDELSTDTSAHRPTIEPEAVKPPQRMTTTAPKFEDAPSNIPPKV